MNCSDFKKRVMSYTDRALAADERNVLESHASDCPACERELRVYRTMRDGFAALPSIGASDELERRILRRVARERAEESEPRFAFPAWSRPFGLALAAGLLMFIGVRSIGDRGAEQATRLATESAPMHVAETPAPERSRVVTSPEARDAAMSPAEAPAVASADEFDAMLDQYLDETGTPLTPLQGGRRYVIDRPGDLPRLLSEGAVGEPASTPISF
jgi:anti-sigma factor RsiW